MKLRLKFVFAILLISFVNNVFADDGKENQNLFNLMETPFINDGTVASFFSFSFNQGPPSHIIDEWQVPDNSKNILFYEYKSGLSFGGRFSFVYKRITANKLEFNSSYIGIKTTPNLNYFGLKAKIYKGEGYYPDYTIGISTPDFPWFDFMVGSFREKFKYYVYIGSYIDILPIPPFIPIPVPQKYAAGIAYEIMDDFNATLEFQPVGDSDDRFNAILFGLSYNVYKFLECQCALYYFDFDFKDSIPRRDPTGGRIPSHIITVPEKDQYYLFSLRVNIALNEKIFQE